MDPRAHNRFLAYLELWQMFGSPDRPKLDRERWLALDAELEALLDRRRAGELTRDETARVEALRRALLRD